MTEKKNQRKRTDPGYDLLVGKIPPQAKDIEEAILGAILIERNAIDSALEFLAPEKFYIEAHQRIFQAMISLNNKSQPIDILTTCEELRKTGELELVGGAYYVTRLTNSVVSSANIEAHSRIVFQKYIQREMIRLGGLLVQDGYEDMIDVFELIDQTEKQLLEITSSLKMNKRKAIDTLLVETIKELEYARQQDLAISGVTSGFRDIDKLTHGWQPTDLIIIAARPSVGKTAFALNMAMNAAKKGTAVAFFSLEMSAKQLIKRMLSCESEINLDKIQRARLDKKDMEQIYVGGVQKLSSAKIIIDDSAGLNVFELRSKARRFKKDNDIGLIIIDYLQLMSGSGNGRQNREQEISEISRNVKKLAKELDIPIIALSQLSRQTETRSDKTPQLSDLRESGAIEQDADVVAFLYRPEYYSIHRDAAGESTAGETHVKFAKHRNGTLDMIKLRAQLWIQKFIDWEEVKKEKVDKEGRNKDGITTTFKPVQVDEQDTLFSNKKSN